MLTKWVLFCIQVIGGLVQSTGWPAVVTCVANWFGKGRLGQLMFSILSMSPCAIPLFLMILWWCSWQIFDCMRTAVNCDRDWSNLERYNVHGRGLDHQIPQPNVAGAHGPKICSHYLHTYAGMVWHRVKNCCMMVTVLRTMFYRVHRAHNNPGEWGNCRK